MADSIKIEAETNTERVSSHGFIPKYTAFSSARDTTFSSTTAAAPETVLFRRKHAPQRFAEHDIYFANDRQSEADDLPESDLLKALHCYTSDFYSRTFDDVVDYRSMDETALIALGILMEEACHLGQNAELALTEGQEIDHDFLSQRMSSEQPDIGRSRSRKRPSKKRKIKIISTSDNHSIEDFESQ